MGNNQVWNFGLPHVRQCLQKCSFVLRPVFAHVRRLIAYVRQLVS